MDRVIDMNLSKINSSVLAIAALLVSTTGCRAIEGIFKAGVWVGVVVVLLLLAIGFAVSRMFVRG